MNDFKAAITHCIDEVALMYGKPYEECAMRMGE
jgi:hypothetical protein